MSNEAILERYHAYLTNEKGSSENTCSSYLRDLRQLAQWLPCTLLEADEQLLQHYIDELKEKGKSAATVSRNVASLKNFYKFYVSAGEVEANPAQHLTAEKAVHKVPEILTSREVELLLDQPRCVDLKGYRDKAMLEVLCSTGIRVTELISLKVSDVDLENSTIRCAVHDKIRKIAVNAAAHKALSDYMTFIRGQMVRNAQDDTLFVNISGGPMSRQGFWKLLKSYQAKAGIEKNITPHTLRHSFAAHMLEKGTDIREVQQIMGHSDVSSTNVYANLHRS